MQVNVDKIILNLDGTPFKVSGKEVRIKEVITGALLNQLPNENIAGKEKYNYFCMAQKVYNAKDGVIDFTAEEISEIKKRVGIHYTAIVVGQVYNVLENR